MASLLYSLTYPWLKADDTHPVTCCICGGAAEQKTLVSFEINGVLFRIDQCTKDRLMYLAPQPGEKYCESLYNHPTYYEGTDDMYGMATNDERSKEIAKIRAGELAEYAPNAASLLEIGCAYGHTLLAAKEKQFKTVKGMEVSALAVRECVQRGLDVVQRDINQLTNFEPGEQYDVIAAYSVLEHLSNPLEFLKRAKNGLSKGGVLVIRTPDTDPSVGPRLSFIDHFWHFDRPGIQNLFTAAGLEIKHIFESGTFKGIEHGGELKNMTVVAAPAS